MARWPWWHQSTGPDEYRIRELLRGIWDLHAMYGADHPWLWRGQANEAFNLEPGIHTRLRRHGQLDDSNVVGFTDGLLAAARHAALDEHEGVQLPDLALLALLQHHGAATPLLDVTLDPIVALYMAVVSPTTDDEEKDGVLFATRRPELSISDFDSRPFADVYNATSGAIAFYSAPDVSERLRIQRGHFLLGQVNDADPKVTLPVSLDAATKTADTWLARRMDARGKQGPPPPATSDIAVFRIVSKFKPVLRTWLEERSGLSRDFVYPTAWHQPHLDRFASSHGRGAQF